MSHDSRNVSIGNQPHATLAAYYGSAEKRRRFVRDLFNSTAPDYDRVERLLAFGSGSWYRRHALRRAGLRPGMRVLDVAMGTGLVAREAMTLAGGPDRVIGLDPSIGMVTEARRRLPVTVCWDAASCCRCARRASTS
jgi:demethylmenaquinone methyltransferase/2-methoxy-6-polyprenyl-1,4-benzoquinol methylase